MPVNVISNLVSKNGGNFPVTEDVYIKGGWQSVADNTARDAIPVERRKEGMAVYVRSSDLIYTLAANLTTWTPLETGGGGGGTTDVVDDTADGLAPQTNGTAAETLVDSGSGAPAWRKLAIADLSDAVDVATTDMLQVKVLGDIILAVNASTGSDGTVGGRPELVTTGDQSAHPYETVDGALAHLPKDTNNYNIRIQVAANVAKQQGFTLDGFVGGGVVDIVCALLQSTVTGSNGGTAGTGTSSTAVKKPTAAANWTAHALRGKLFVPQSGGGFYGDTTQDIVENLGPCIRRIIDNTTDTITIEPMSGVDNTTVFKIMESAVTFEGAARNYAGLTYSIGVFGNVAQLYFRNMKCDDNTQLWGILGQLNGYVNVFGVDSPNAAFSGVGFYDTQNLTISQCWAHGNASSYYDLYQGGRVQVNGFVNDGSRLDATHWLRAVGSVWAKTCATNAALRVRHCEYAAWDLDANSCTITPLVLTNLHLFEIYGNNGLTGTNAGTNYFCSIAGGGQYKLTGATGAGSSGTQVIVEGDTDAGLLSWTELALGTFAFRGNFLYWGAGPTRWVGPTSGYRGDVYETVDADLVVTNTMSGTVQEVNSDDPHTATLPKTAKKGFSITFVQTGDGQLTVAPESGATMFNIDAHDKTAGKGAICMAYVSTNSDGMSAYYIFGGRTAS